MLSTFTIGLVEVNLEELHMPWSERPLRARAATDGARLNFRYPATDAYGDQQLDGEMAIVSKRFVEAAVEPASSTITRWAGRALRSLPRGGSLPEENWRRRHRVIVALVWGHTVAIPMFAVARGYSLAHGLLDGSPILIFAILASLPGHSRKALSIASAMGLLSSSGALVHLSGGTIEAHFHFFVVVGVLTMYEDWAPFLLAIGYVLVHHGLMGALTPRSVYNHPAAWAHPWRWAAIHAAFVLAASAVLVLAWRMNEDIRARLADSLDQLHQTNEERRLLLGSVVHAREDEGKRIAAELHDGPVQRLTQLDYMAERAQLRLEAGGLEGARGLLGEVQDGLREEIKGLRRMMTELRPPALDERGLSAAFHDHVEGVERRSGVRCTVRAGIGGRLRPAVEAALYRVMQEALMNVVKHAEATEAAVSLDCLDGRVVLRVSDDGRGFDPVQVLRSMGRDHFGLIAIRERVLMEGGECDVRSRPGGGTEIRVSFPDEVMVS
jgi:signal transduction histidine kinase